MKLEHIAVSSNSETESDKFFMHLLQLKKTRSFTVNSELSEKFFGIKKEQSIIHYSDDNMDVEVFITNDETKAKDIYTHVCLSVGNKEKVLEKAELLGFYVIKVPRNDVTSYYSFIKDHFGNLYEIK